MVEVRLPEGDSSTNRPADPEPASVDGEQHDSTANVHSETEVPGATAGMRWRRSLMLGAIPLAGMAAALGAWRASIAYRATSPIVTAQPAKSAQFQRPLTDPPVESDSSVESDLQAAAPQPSASADLVPETPSISDAPAVNTEPTPLAETQSPQTTPRETAPEPGKQVEESVPAVIRQAMNTRLPALDLDAVPLVDVLEFLSDFCKLKFAVDDAALTAIGGSPQDRVDLHLKNATVAETLQSILEPRKLTYRVRNGEVLILPRPER